MKNETEKEATKRRGVSELTRLLCCPFCGGEPKTERIGNDYTKKRKVRIWCPDCRVERTNAGLRKGVDWLEEISIKQWNKREIKKSLIEAYENYIELLCAELDDLAGLADSHGWESDRIEAGKEARKQIKNIKEKAT